MPTSWTNYTPTSTASYTAYTPTSTDTWTQLEPTGWGLEPWGSPSTTEHGLKIHMRGWGSPTTHWSEYDETP